MCEALVREWQGGVSSSTHNVPWRQEVNHARLSKHRPLLITAFSLVYLSVCACCLFWWCKTALGGWKEWQTCPAIAMTRILCQDWAAGRRFPWLRSDPPGLVFSVRFCQTASNRLASFLYQHLCSSALCDGKSRRRWAVWTRQFCPFCDRFAGLFFLFSLSLFCYPLFWLCVFESCTFWFCPLPFLSLFESCTFCPLRIQSHRISGFDVSLQLAHGKLSGGFPLVSVLFLSAHPSVAVGLSVSDRVRENFELLFT